MPSRATIESWRDALRMIGWLLIWLLLAGAAQAQSAMRMDRISAAAGLVAPQVLGQPSRNDPSEHQKKPHQSRKPPAISAQQAAERARERFGGHVLNVVLDRGAGGPYYRVKILEHGRVRVVNIDARR